MADKEWSPVTHQPTSTINLHVRTIRHISGHCNMIKEQETCLTFQEHDDDDDDAKWLSGETKHKKLYNCNHSEKINYDRKKYFRYFLNWPCTTACFTQDAADYLWDIQYFKLMAGQCWYYSRRRKVQCLVIPICAIYMNGAWPTDQCLHLIQWWKSISLPNHQAEWLKQKCFWLAFRRHPVQISAETPTIQHNPVFPTTSLDKF